MDASIHDWLEGRGEDMVLISMIDDATSLVLARFYPAGTVKAHMDLLGRWLSQHGRPVALYTDRHSIFEPQDKGKALAEGVTQFGRALGELDIELIRAHSPQAKGRVERRFGTAQDRWVKELHLAGVRTLTHANVVLEQLLPEHNRRFAKPAAQAVDAHRPLGLGHVLDGSCELRGRCQWNRRQRRLGHSSSRSREIAKPGLECLDCLGACLVSLKDELLQRTQVP
jgi:hypothetical protein